MSIKSEQDPHQLIKIDIITTRWALYACACGSTGYGSLSPQFAGTRAIVDRVIRNHSQHYLRSQK